MFSSSIASWSMWAVASIFYAYQYVLRVMPSILMPDIMEKYQIDASVFGQLSGVYYIGYSLMHIPLGIMLDRFGPRKIMPIFMLLTVIGLVPLVMTDFFIYPLLGRALVGIGSSSAILGLFKIIRMSFDEKKFTWMLSLAVTVGLLGAIYGGAPLHYLRESMGFDLLVMVLMALGLGLSLLMWLIIPAQKEKIQEGNILANIKSVLTNKMVLAICLLAGLMVGPLEGFADAWGTAFLKTVYGFEDSVAAGLPSMMFFGMCFGGPLLSIVLTKTKSASLVIFMCAVAMCLGFIVLITTSQTAAALSMLFFMIGILCGYQIVAIAHASNQVSAHMAGLTSAVANMIIMIFGYVFHATIGNCVAYFNQTNDVVDTISPQALVYGIAVIPIALAIAALGFFYIFWQEKMAQNKVINKLGHLLKMGDL